jgi:hypothetical protein
MTTTTDGFVLHLLAGGACRGSSAWRGGEGTELRDRLPDPAGAEEQGRGHAPDGASPTVPAHPAARARGAEQLRPPSVEGPGIGGRNGGGPVAALWGGQRSRKGKCVCDSFVGRVAICRKCKALYMRGK